MHRIGRTGRAGLTGEAISLVAPQDHEAIGAIERLIKKRIERVLVPGFQPSGASVAAMMGDERRKAPRSAPKPAGDPIFSRPYEPSSAAAPVKAAEPEVRSKRRQPQVAALLGGLKRA